MHTTSRHRRLHMLVVAGGVLKGVKSFHFFVSKRFSSPHTAFCVAWSDRRCSFHMCRISADEKIHENMPPTESCEVKLDGSSSSDTDLSKKDRKVHFADSMGLALVSVVYLPTPAPKGRLPPRSRKARSRWSSFEEEKARLLNFTQPLKRPDFNESLNILNVSLETIFLRDFGMFGTVKVRNLAYHKKITVRYTIDGWSTFRDVVGQHIEGSHTSFTDTFSFEIALPSTLIKDCKFEFAICYKVHGVELWDNNNGDNYRVMCYSPNRWKSRDWLSKYNNNLDICTQNRYVGLRF